MAKRKTNNSYFTSETEGYVLQYNNQDDVNARQQIYVIHLQKPFRKIASALCNKYKIKQRIQNQQIVLHQCISSMIQKMPYFSSQRGKAFTYFTIIARNCILSNLHKSIKYNDRYRSIDQMTSNDATTSFAIQHAAQQQWVYSIQQQYNQEIMKKTIIKLQQYIVSVLIPSAQKQTEKLVCLGVLQLIGDVQRLNTLNRKTVLLYLRQITQLSTQVITSVLNKIGLSYFKLKTDVVQNDLSLLQYQMLI